MGELAGAGTISPSHALDFKMRATVHANAVVSTLAPPNIPFLITGTSSDPLFRPDVGQLATEEINRGLNGVKVGGLDVGKTAGQALRVCWGVRNKKAGAVRSAPARDTRITANRAVVILRMHRDDVPS